MLLGGPSGFTPDPTFPQMFGRTASATFADLDGDADLDLVVGRNYRNKVNGTTPTVVLRNDAGQLSVATTLVTNLGARSIGVLDYNGDSRLDLFVTEDHWSGGTSILFRNDGNLQFSDATVSAGLPPNIHGLGVATADLTADGRPDLVVSGSLPPKGQAQIAVARVFVNSPSSEFHEVAVPAFTMATFGNEDDAAGVAVGDLNRDGLPDVVIGQHYGSTLQTGTTAPVGIYLHQGLDANGAPVFSDATVVSGSPGLATKSPHVEIADLDNDGYLDILTTASSAGGTRPVVLHSTGIVDGVPQFVASPGLGDTQYWPTGATADYDRDGRLDVLGVEWYPSLPSRLFRNDTDSGHWLDVELVGPGNGIGATVEVYCAGGLGQPASLIASGQLGASTGFGAGVPTRLHAGLGDTTTTDVRVRLPNGGATIDRTAVAADQVLEVPIASTPANLVLPSVYVSDVRVVEGDSGTAAAVFTVSLSAANPQRAVSVKYATANGTAKAPADYTAIAKTTLSFAAGQTVKTVSVAVQGDLVAEADEAFLLKLSTPSGVTIGDAAGTATILDEERPPVIHIGDASVVEGPSGPTAMEFPVTLSRASPGAVSVRFATANGDSGRPVRLHETGIDDAQLRCR